MADRGRVLITGAGGNIGSKVRRYLEKRGQFDLTLIDRDDTGDIALIPADLSHYDDSWAHHFHGVEVVLHLAAEARPNASWSALEAPNVDAVINVYEACVAQGVSRLIFASSMHTVMDRLRRGRNVTTGAPACPANFYGATKVVGERLGKSYAERHGLSVICLRIGMVQPGDNLPGSHLGAGWKQQLWLSHHDLCRGFEQAILVTDVSFAVLSLTSNNGSMPWDLSETSRILQFVSQDGYMPDPTPRSARLRQWARRGRRWLCRAPRIRTRR